MDEELWSAAIRAQRTMEDLPGLYETWLWAQSLNQQWMVSDPLCYIQLAHGAAADQPMLGEPCNPCSDAGRMATDPSSYQQLRCFPVALQAYMTHLYPQFDTCLRSSLDTSPIKILNWCCAYQTGTGSTPVPRLSKLLIVQCLQQGSPTHGTVGETELFMAVQCGSPAYLLRCKHVMLAFTRTQQGRNQEFFYSYRFRNSFEAFGRILLNMGARSLDLCDAGLRLLLAYQSQDYSMPLPLEACNSFLQHCVGSEHSDQSGEAALALLAAMHQPQLPGPNLDTYCAVTECLLVGLKDGGAGYQLLVQLYEHVLPLLHAQFASGPEAAHVYYAALAGFNEADAATKHRLNAACCVQLVVLMAQRGMSGLTSVGCELLLEAVDQYSEAWLRSVFGDVFVDAVEAVFVGDTVLTCVEDVVPFPLLSLPAFAVRHIDAKRAYLDFVQGDMPEFMVPADAWPSYHLRRTNNDSHTQVDRQPDAGEQLDQQYGHLLSNKNGRGRIN